MINKNFYALTGMSIGDITYTPNGFFGVNTKGETKKYYFYKGNSKILSGTRAENITLTSSNNIVSVFDKNGVCTKQYKK